MTGSYVKLEIPQNLKGAISAIGVEANSAIRAAIKTAMIPARAYMKQLVNTETSKSLQSSGATYRSVITKNAQSLKNPNVFYGMVGIDKHVVEEHYLPTNPISESKKTYRKQGTATGKGLYSEQTKYKKDRRRKTTKIKTRQVFSRLKITSRLSRNDKARNSIRRVPKKYFHILENGFKTRLNGPNMPYKFVAKTLAATGDEVLKIFKERLTYSMAIVVVKHMNKVITKSQ